MIRLNKVRPYLATEEELFVLELYDHEQKFNLILKQPPVNPIIIDEIIYDGGGVSLDEEEIEVIVDGTKNN